MSGLNLTSEWIESCFNSGFLFNYTPGPAASKPATESATFCRLLVTRLVIAELGLDCYGLHLPNKLHTYSLPVICSHPKNEWAKAIAKSKYLNLCSIRLAKPGHD